MDGYTPYEAYHSASDNDGPHSQDAEHALIGSLLYAGMSAYVEARDVVGPDDFYNPINVEIVRAMWSRFELGLPVDAIILNARFQKNGRFKGEKDLDIPAYLAMLLDAAPTGDVAREYGKLINDLSHRRALIKQCRETIAEAENLDQDDRASDIHSKHAIDMTAIEGSYASPDAFISLREAGRAELEKVGNQDAMGLDTGLTELTEAIRGFQREKFYVGAGRPGMFKSGALANFARAVAKNGGKVGIFSLEMGAGENAVRGLSNQLGTGNPIEYRDISSHRVSDNGMQRLYGALEAMPDALIDPTPGITITLLEKRARAMKKQMGGLDFLGIDYVQLMGDSDVRGRNDTRAAALSVITSRLKSLSKALNVPIYTLAQVNRGVDNRDDKRPKLADLRDSGSIEQDADVVMFFYREEYYHRKTQRPQGFTEGGEWDVKLGEVRNKMDIIIAKNRSGPETTVEVQVDLGTDSMMDKGSEPAMPSLDI